jgi:hypothetical protein
VRSKSSTHSTHGDRSGSSTARTVDFPTPLAPVISSTTEATIAEVQHAPPVSSGVRFRALRSLRLRSAAAAWRNFDTCCSGAESRRPGCGERSLSSPASGLTGRLVCDVSVAPVAVSAEEAAVLFRVLQRRDEATVLSYRRAAVSVIRRCVPDRSGAPSWLLGFRLPRRSGVRVSASVSRQPALVRLAWDPPVGSPLVPAGRQRLVPDALQSSRAPPQMLVLP